MVGRPHFHCDGPVRIKHLVLSDGRRDQAAPGSQDHLIVNSRKGRVTMIESMKSMLDELHQEAATTRRLLERVPGEKLSWKPHPKSMSLGQLALHVAKIPGDLAR